MLWLLLKNKITIAINSLVRDNFTKRRRKFAGIVGGAIIFYFVYDWIFDIFSILLITHDQGIILINNLIVVFFAGFLFFLFASGVTIAIHYLFISSDLALLLSSPISNRTILSYKLIESIFANSSFFIFLGVPIFIAYGIATNAAWFYYPLMIVDMLLFLAFPLCLAFLIAIGVVRLMSAARAKELMTGVLGILSIGIWFFIQIMRAAQLNPQSVEYQPERITQIQHWGQVNFLPATYAARSLIAFAQADIRSMLANFIPLLLLTAFIFTVSLVLSERLFREGIIGFHDERAKRKQPTYENRRQRPVFFTSVAGQIFIRDFKLLIRDFRHLTNALILCAMMIIFPLTRAPDLMDSATESFLPFIPVMMLSAFASSQLASRLIPLEGKSFWMMLTMPQSWRTMLTGKFFVGFLLNTIAVWAAIGIAGIYLQPPLRILILLYVSSAGLTWVMNIFGLTLGCLFPNFAWEHPKRMLSSGGGLVLAIGSLILIGCWAGVLAIIYSIGADFFSTVLLDIIGVIFSVLMIITSTVVGFYVCTKKLRHLEWQQ